MNNQDRVCPDCEHGQLHESTFADDFKHGNALIHVDGLECYVCDECGADPVFEDQIRRNHLRIADAKREYDGLLTGTEIKAIREKLELTQNDAANVFGGGPNAFSKYERGDVIQSKSMDKLIRLVSKSPLNLLELFRLANMPMAEEIHFKDTYARSPSADTGRIQMPIRKPATAKIISMHNWKKTAA